jgi:hypothetical protein
MSPETLSAIQAISAAIQHIGSWPIASILLAVLFGPWVLTILVSRQQEKKYDALNLEQGKRFEAVKAMYESNVRLVQAYEKVAEVQCELISLNTAKWAESIQKIDSNQFCPFARIKKQRMENVPSEPGSPTP